MAINVSAASFCTWLFLLFSPSVLGMDPQVYEVVITPHDAKTYGIMFDEDVALRSRSFALLTNSLSIQRILQALRNYQKALEREGELDPGKRLGPEDSRQLLQVLTRLESEINIYVVKK